jgi:uncharacterized protein
VSKLRKLKMTIGNVSITAKLLDTPTANALYAAAPFSSSVQTWGEEVYFSTPVHVALESGAKAVVQAGELAFWVEGDSIAIGFGPTPISQDNEIRLAAPTNIWGHAEENVRDLIDVPSGSAITVEVIE